MNLHCRFEGRKAGSQLLFDSPAPEVIDVGSRYVRLGNVNGPTVATQKDIVKYVIGTHPKLRPKYLHLAKSRKDTWQSWVNDGNNSDLYQSVHLPDIAFHFRHVWETPIHASGPKEISATVLDLVKAEIVELMVRMFVLPVENLETIMVRRSRRIQSAMGFGVDIEIIPGPSLKRKRLTRASLSSASGKAVRRGFF